MAKLQVLYEQGDSWTAEPGQARVRLMKAWDPDNHPVYVLESWLTGDPIMAYDWDAGREVPRRCCVEHGQEVLASDNLFMEDWEAIRAAIARYDDLAGRWDAPTDDEPARLPHIQKVGMSDFDH